jgi:toxin ParE1/3/4
LAEIWAYLAAEASEAIATRLVNRIKDDMSPYCQFPRSGPARDQLAKGLRAGFSGNYVVYYRPTETELMIVRVLHGARDAAAIFSSGGFV